MGVTVVEALEKRVTAFDAFVVVVESDVFEDAVVVGGFVTDVVAVVVTSSIYFNDQSKKCNIYNFYYSI